MSHMFLPTFMTKGMHAFGLLTRARKWKQFIPSSPDKTTTITFMYK